MKQTITENDLVLLGGKFIIELNTEQPIELTDNKVNLDFYLIKRVNFISFNNGNVITSDLVGNTLTYSKEKFIEWFNDYLGESKGTRYHRLLYNKELDIVFDFIKNRNY